MRSYHIEDAFCIRPRQAATADQRNRGLERNLRRPTACHMDVRRRVVVGVDDEA